ncbi:hypothetical protein L6452_19354 [Arctium lappa]|uniref:Uncharacterized protein n=1 Tax=Arctium lappa TaxID=4217 RepID=A0ACB9BCR8_ARCLA|nr:hypothetical protein L6452_19354 [Arctium lappa]
MSFDMLNAEMDELRREFRDDIGELSKKLDMLLGGLIRGDSDSEMHQIQNSCNYCGDPLHSIDNCTELYYEKVNGQYSCIYCGDPWHSINECGRFHDGCVNKSQGFTNYNEDMSSDSYNPGWQEQPDFFWECQYESSSSQPCFLGQYHSGNYHQNDQFQNDHFHGNYDYNNQESSLLEEQMQDMMVMMKEQMQYANNVNQSIVALGAKVSELTEQLIEIDEIEHNQNHGEEKETAKTIEATLEHDLELIDLDETEALLAEPITTDQASWTYENKVVPSLAQEPSKTPLDQPPSLELNTSFDCILRPILKDLTVVERGLTEDSVGIDSSKCTNQALVESNEKPLRELNPS